MSEASKNLKSCYTKEITSINKLLRLFKKVNFNYPNIDELVKILDTIVKTDLECSDKTTKALLLCLLSHIELILKHPIQFLLFEKNICNILEATKVYIKKSNKRR